MSDQTITTGDATLPGRRSFVLKSDRKKRVTVTMISVTLGIVLDYERNTHGDTTVRAGEFLSGRVCVTVPHTIRRGNLKVCICGKEESWIQTMRSEKIILHDETILCNLMNDRLLPGYYELPFSIRLPVSLPSSTVLNVEGNSGGVQVVYDIRATLNNETFTERTFQVQASSPLPDADNIKVPRLGGPITCEIWHGELLRKGYLSLAAGSENTHVHRGSIFEFAVACRNQCSAEIECVQVQLVEQIKWTAEDQKNARRRVLLEFNETNLDGLGSCEQHRKIHNSRQDGDFSHHRGMVEELKSTSNRLCLIIPERCRETYRGWIVDISHYVEVKLVVKSLAKVLSVTIPLRVDAPSGRISPSSYEPGMSRQNDRHAQSFGSPETLPSCVQARASASIDSTLSATATQSTGPEYEESQHHQVYDRSAQAYRFQSEERFSSASKPKQALPAGVALKMLLDEMIMSGNGYDVVSEKLEDNSWREILASVNANEFGCIVAHEKNDYDRPRLATLLAQHFLVGFFSCEHAAAAIRKTSFQASMADRLLPFCVDVDINMGLIKKELKEWDLSLLSHKIHDQKHHVGSTFL